MTMRVLPRLLPLLLVVLHTRAAPVSSDAVSSDGTSTSLSFSDYLLSFFNPVTPLASKNVFGMNPNRFASPHTSAPPMGATGIVTPAITNHGGGVIATPRVYIIWVGNWNSPTNGVDTPAGQQIIRDFFSTIGNSSYFQLNQGYGMTGNVSFTPGAKNEVTVTSSGSTLSLSDNGVASLVVNAIKANQLPYDSNGAYFVLGASNVYELSGFCSQYCGWHSSYTAKRIAGNIRVAFVASPRRCMNGCAVQAVGPNGNGPVDAMISVIAHELEELASDPDLNGWYDSAGEENGDKCSWTYGSAMYTAANGAMANVKLGARDFLIQRNLQHTLTGDFCKVNDTTS